MARSAVTVATASLNGSATITKDAIDITNDHSIDVSDIKDQNLRIFIETTSTAAAIFSVKAGDFSGASVGDLDISTADSATRVVQIESARFKDSDELVLIDIASTAGVTGNIYAIAGA
jgi:hypothetical protein